MPYRSIPRPVDFSDHSPQALPWAVALAGRDRAQLTVLGLNESLLVEAAAAAYDAACVQKETESELRDLVLYVIPGNASWAPVARVIVKVGDPEIVPVAVHERILAGNDRTAAPHNRARFREHGVLVVNVMGSPDAGKTAVLEGTARAPRGRRRLGALAGDLATECDAHLPDVNVDAIRDVLAHVMPNPVLLAISARTGEGIERWSAWLDELYRRGQPVAATTVATT